MQSLSRRWWRRLVLVILRILVREVWVCGRKDGRFRAGIPACRVGLAYGRRLVAWEVRCRSWGRGGCCKDFWLGYLMLAV